VGNEHYHNRYHYKDPKLVSLVNTDYFLGWPNTGMMEWTYGAEQGPGGHFLEAGHKIVANQIYEHIRHLGWIS